MAAGPWLFARHRAHPPFRAAQPLCASWPSSAFPTWPRSASRPWSPTSATSTTTAKPTGRLCRFRTQSHRLVAVKLLFSWLVRQGRLGFDPAAAIELPKVERRLPEATLSAEEAEAVLAGPDVTTPLGLRDRAVLEVFYSSALRRSELIGLRLADIDGARGTVFVRQGKGAKDRYVPIGERAVAGLGVMSKK